MCGSFAHAPSRDGGGGSTTSARQAFGVCLSYRPMLHKLTSAAMGGTADVFKYESGHEAWVDRKLNVIGSGFMCARRATRQMPGHALWRRVDAACHENGVRAATSRVACARGQAQPVL
jgi:hypothetical protein